MIVSTEELPNIKIVYEYTRKPGESGQAFTSRVSNRMSRIVRQRGPIAIACQTNRTEGRIEAVYPVTDMPPTRVVYPRTLKPSPFNLEDEYPWLS